MRWTTKLLLVLVPLVLAYFITAFVIFDFTRPAFPFSQNDASSGKLKAVGPRPKERYCPPTWGGEYWKGNEWPFIVFCPICYCWCHSHGYSYAAFGRAG
jgi:hypothetical protein